MVDWSTKFKWQYDYAKASLADASRFADEWKDTIEALQKLQGTTGFTLAEAKALEKLRKQMKKIGKKEVSVADGILAAVKVGGNNAPNVPQEAKMRASALKFLAHTYLLNTSGKRTVWLHSSPKKFRHWPSVHMHNYSNTTGEVKEILNSSREQFNSRAKKHLKTASGRALNWVHKTNLVLGHAPSSQTKGKPSWAREAVRTWFADPSVTEGQLDGYISKLSLGFKEITATLNKGTMILTDYMGLRQASTADELSFLNAEAFTWASRGEGLDVVYVEKEFFGNDPGNILQGEANWARILIHELTHLCCGTADVKNGQARYAHYGIGPHAGYPGSQAITNADNWAFFAVYCGGGITDSQMKKALKII